MHCFARLEQRGGRSIWASGLLCREPDLPKASRCATLPPGCRWRVLVETDAPGWLRRRIAASATNPPGLADTVVLPSFAVDKEEIASATTKNFYRLFHLQPDVETDRGAPAARHSGGRQRRIQPGELRPVARREKSHGQENSFDVVSKVDIQEVRNAIDQALKEVRSAST